jgi:hypothetical protein
MPGIDDFKSKLTGGGARANLFQVSLAWPGANSSGINDASFLIKAATLPASSIENIDLAYRGRMLKIAGDRTFENWTVTVINDTDMRIRSEMERWMSIINAHTANVSALSSANALGYYRNLAVAQLDRNENITKEYTFVGAYPVNVSSIDLAYDTNNAVEEFTVEFAYQYWTDAVNGII